jgi:hypothetical protein
MANAIKIKMSGTQNSVPDFADFEIGELAYNYYDGRLFGRTFDGVTEAIVAIGEQEHGFLPGLTDDDHTQYALLAGRAGGQTLIGGTASGDNLTLQSTSNATKGKIYLGSNSYYDEANSRLNINSAQGLGVFGATENSTTLAKSTAIFERTVAINSFSGNTAVGAYPYAFALQNQDVSQTDNLVAFGFDVLTGAAISNGAIVAQSISPGNLKFDFYTETGNTEVKRFTMSSVNESYMSLNVGSGITNAARLHVKGAGATSATSALKVDNSSNNTKFNVRDDGFIAHNMHAIAQVGLLQSDTANGAWFDDALSKPTWRLSYNGTSVIDFCMGTAYDAIITNPYNFGSPGGMYIGAATTKATQQLYFRKNGGSSSFINGDVSIGNFVPTSKLHVRGADATSATYALKLDNSAGTSLLSVRNDGLVDIASDLTFTGSGTGLPYGGIYAANNTTNTTLNSASKTQILIFDTNGVSNLITPDHTNDHITITTAGVYQLSLYTSVSNQAGSAHKISVSVWKNNGATELTNTHVHRTLASGTDTGSIGITAHVTLTVGDTIEVWANTDRALDSDILFEDINMNLTMIGG